MWSKWGVDNLDKRVIEKNPDTVLIEFAINDAYLPHKTSVEQARSNLENMIGRILKSHPDCEIVLMVMNPPIGVHLERRPKVKDYCQMYRDVAKNRKLLLIDHYPKWEKLLNEARELFNKYVPDGLHPGPEGCKIVILSEIIKSLGVRHLRQSRVTCFPWNWNPLVMGYRNPVPLPSLALRDWHQSEKPSQTGCCDSSDTMSSTTR